MEDTAGEDSLHSWRDQFVLKFRERNAVPASFRVLVAAHAHLSKSNTVLSSQKEAALKQLLILQHEHAGSAGQEVVTQLEGKVWRRPLRAAARAYRNAPRVWCHSRRTASPVPCLKSLTPRLWLLRIRRWRFGVRAPGAGAAGGAAGRGQGRGGAAGSAVPPPRRGDEPRGLLPVLGVPPHRARRHRGGVHAPRGERRRPPGRDGDAAGNACRQGGGMRQAPGKSEPGVSCPAAARQVR